MGLDYQLHRVAVDAAKGYSQLQKASNAFSKGKVDSGGNHLNKAYNDFSAAMEHAVKAEEDAYVKAGKEIDKGNAELQKSIDAYAEGHDGRAESHYESAVESYDVALELIS